MRSAGFFVGGVSLPGRHSSNSHQLRAFLIRPPIAFHHLKDGSMSESNLQTLNVHLAFLPGQQVQLSESGERGRVTGFSVAEHGPPDFLVLYVDAHGCQKHEWFKGDFLRPVTEEKSRDVKSEVADFWRHVQAGGRFFVVR